MLDLGCTVDWKNKLYTCMILYLRAQMAVGAVLWTPASPNKIILGALKNK